MDVPRISISIRENNLLEDGLKVVSVIRPSWIEEHTKNGVEILTKTFSDGMTNKLFGFRLATDSIKEMILFKIYGEKTELMIDREAEIATFKLLYKHKCGSQLYGIFNNGICYEFIPGRCLTMETCRSPSVYPLVAQEMARLHKSIPLKPGQTQVKSSVWNKLRHFYHLHQQVLAENEPLRNKLQNDFDYNLETLKNVIDELELILEKENMPIVFCHNDILLNNVVYNEHENYVKFIDFEYAEPNYAPYELANHFMEFCGIDQPDYSLLPKKEFRREWISHYLKAYKTNGFTQEQFEKWVDLCLPLSDLYWAMWCVIQAHVSTIEFDYIGYTGLRYVKCKQLLNDIRNGKFAPE